MKKLLAIIVLTLCVPAMASVTVTTDNSTDGQIAVTLTADGTETTELVGVALTVDADAPLTACSVVESFFDIYVDSAFTAGAGYALGDGIPTAKQGEAGELALPQANFVVSVAGLDDDGIGTGTDEAPLTCTIILEGPAGTLVTVSADELRGTCVSYAGAAAVTGLPATDVEILGGTPTCEDMFEGAELANYQAYVTNGMDPSCWCWQYQCRGDADNATEQFGPFFYRVYTIDLAALSAAWKAQVTDTNANPCADFSHDSEQFGPFFYTVYTKDLATLSTNWKAQDSQLDDCPGYIAAP